MAIEDDNTFGFDGAETPSMTSAPGTGVGVVSVSKREYAVCLAWHGVEQPSKAAAEARQKALDPDFQANFYCLRKTNTPQFGLGFRTQGHKSNMPSLAAHAAEAKSGSWIGLFEVVGGYYFLAVRDEAILAESDKFFEDADDARNAFEEFQIGAEWDEAIAPNDFDIPGTRHVKLEDLLDGKPPVRLVEVRSSSNIIRLGLAVIAVGGLVVGGMMYLNHQEELRLAEEAQQAFIDAQNAIMGPEPVEIPPMPWEGQRMGAPFVTACVEDILKFPTDIPRWSVKQFFCEHGTVAAAIDRDGQLGEGGGSLNWISLTVKDFGRGATVIPPAEGSGSLASVQWNIKDTPMIPVDLKTAPVAKMKAALLGQFEERLTPIMFSNVDTTEFWTGFSFHFSTKEDPRGYLDVLGAIPGLIVNSVTYNVDDIEWTIEGKAYEQLPLPQQSASN